jgi:hypothetical protein
MKKEKPQNKTLKAKTEVKDESVGTPNVPNETIEVPELNATEIYEFVANGTFHTLPKGSVWKITGEAAMIFLKKGYGKLK